jgi:hypothetical protein
MNPPAPHIPGLDPLEGNNSTATQPVTPIAPTLFSQDDIAEMQSEMQRLMRDFPDGNIPPEIIAEWEAKAEAARLGQEGAMLAESIAADESAHRTRTPRTPRTPKADVPPADMQPAEQDSTAPDVIKLNRADSKLATQVGRLYAVIGLGVHMMNETDGVIIISESQNRAKELVLLSNHHPALKKALRNLTESNDYITFAFGHGGMLFAIMQAHGIMPRDVGRRVFGMLRRPAQAAVPEMG